MNTQQAQREGAGGPAPVTNLAGGPPIHPVEPPERQREGAYAPGSRLPGSPRAVAAPLVAIALALAATGGLGCSTPEEGPEPEVVTSDVMAVHKLATDDSALYWAAGHIGKLSFDGGAAGKLGGDGVCDVASDGEWLYLLDDRDAGFIPADSGTFAPDDLSLNFTRSSVGGRQPRCGTLALAPTQAFAVAAAYGDESWMLNAPIGIAGAAITDLTGEEIISLVADDDAVYYLNGEGELIKLGAGQAGEEVLASGLSRARRLKMDQDRLYWRMTGSQPNGANIWRLRSIAKSGGAVEDVATVAGGCGFFSGYAIDGGYAYFGFNVDLEGFDDNGGCHDDDVVAVARVPLSGGEREIIAQRRSIDTPDRFAVGGGRVFFSDCDGIGDCSIKSLPLP